MTELEESIVELYKQGIGCRRIAKELCCSLDWVKEVKRKYFGKSEHFANSDDSVSQKVASKYSKFEYAGGYISIDKDFYLTCKDCGNTFKRGAQVIRKSRNVNVQCPYCSEVLKEIKYKKEHPIKKWEPIPIEGNQEELKICPICNSAFYGNKIYCSYICRKKKENRDKEFSRRMKLRSQMVDKDITLEKLFLRDHGKCYICGCDCNFKDSEWKNGAFHVGDTYPTIEHVKPLSSGGAHSWSNVKLACFKCNTIKGAVDFLFNEKKEKEKLKNIVSRLDEPRRLLTEGLVDDAAFMIEQISKLQDYIRENGVSEKYQNGANQSGMKQSVQASTYIQFQKSYLSTIKILEGMLPADKSKQNNDDELLDFLRTR